jgi:hypothetical protein
VRTTLKGSIAEAAITSEATRLGIAVMRPSIEGRRYDVSRYRLAIDEFAGQSYAHLRLAPARNGQRLLVKSAADIRSGL